MRFAGKHAARIRRVGKSSIFRVSTRTGQPIRPIVIAHRGASGYLPEHTFAAKALAYAMGADYLEQDVVATRDNELVVLHDIHLDRTTNVADVFPSRARRDGRYYARDFTLDELKTLAVRHRTNADGAPVYPRRFVDGDVHRVNTLTEEIEFIHRLIDSVGRPVGIYPEIKSPAWHRQEGFDITPAVLSVLEQSGYDAHTDPVYLQCFDEPELLRIRNEYDSDLKLIQLIGENAWHESETDYDELRTPAGLGRIAKTADGIGPWVEQLYKADPSGGVADSGLVANAHDAGLAVHPYTFREDDVPADFRDLEELLRFTVDELCIDGLFTDFPDRVVRSGKNDD